MPAEMREALIKQAVTFLVNPGLNSTTLEKKQEFLQNKGLSEEEVKEAFRRAEEKKDEPASPSSTAVSTSRQPVAFASGSPTGTAASSQSAAAAGAPTVPPAASMQAMLLLKRRLAELEHERACYIEAISALGGSHMLDASPPLSLLPRAPSVAGPASLPAPAYAAAAPAATSPAAPAAPSVSTGVAGAQVRESEVKQAVIFLKNPGLGTTPWEDKRTFLKGKGLADAEIDEARRRAEEAAAPPPGSPAPAAAVATTPQKRKPWESVAPAEQREGATEGAEAAGALPVVEEGLRDDDPDLVEILQPRKPEVES
mmetsp:Transcript_86469/g.245183  ORF Transcript_86469/g.245183 Transcript_86469/m.245183 type:complete len:313 (-) Transcript_86469:66-1004(-)